MAGAMTHAPSKVELVMEGIAAQLRAGTLRAGERLASIREQAIRAGVARNTVVEAYLRLVAQGVLQARPGSGYYVVRSSRLAPAAPRSGAATGGTVLLTEQLERRLPIRPGDGRPPPDWLEQSELRRHLSVASLRGADAYNSAWGFLPLRERLCGALAERGIGCRPEQMFMTFGANHAMDLIVRAHVRPGDAVLVDDPGYYPLFSKLHLAGARIVGVRRLRDGPDLTELERKARDSGARLFFTQSLAHNPTGGSITPGAAFGVLRVAGACDLLVVEDDPFADILPYSATRLAALDQLDRVIYVGTFSKTLAASFRVGYVAASPARAAALNDVKLMTTVATSAHDERLVFGLIDQGHYLKHLRRLRGRVSRATAATIAELEAVGCPVQRPVGGGFYLWIRLPGAPLLTADVEAAASRGIFIAPSSAFSATAEPEAAMRINVAYGTHPIFLDWLKPRLALGARF